MANLDMVFPDDFLSGLLDSDFSEIAEEALNESAPILKESVQSSLRRVINHNGDSALINSIKISKPKRTRTDAFIINVGPSGNSDTYYYQGKKEKRKYPVSNAMKAIWLEYGRVGQSAKPWLGVATTTAQSKITKVLQDTYEKKVTK